MSELSTLDVSNGLLNVSDIPTTFQNLTSTTAEEKTREQSTRRNLYLVKYSKEIV